jgi:hypothetical protein
MVALAMGMHLVQDAIAHDGITTMKQHVHKYGSEDDNNLADMVTAQDATLKFLAEFRTLLVAHLGEQGAQDALLNMSAAASDLSSSALKKYVDDLTTQIDGLIQWQNSISNTHSPSAK